MQQALNSCRDGRIPMLMLFQTLRWHPLSVQNFLYAYILFFRWMIVFSIPFSNGVMVYPNCLIAFSEVKARFCARRSMTAADICVSFPKSSQNILYRNPQAFNTNFGTRMRLILLPAFALMVVKKD